MNFRQLVLTALACAGLGRALAQQEVMVSQYMFNQLFLNPAYAGSHPYMSSSLLHRAQWLRVDGAPQTSMMAVDAPLMKGKMGAGLSIVHDRIGVSRDLDIAGHYAYHIRVSEGSKLAFGLRAGLSLYSADLSQLTKAFTEYFSNFGFAFARSEVRTDVDRATNRVELTLLAEPSRRVYVRRISVAGNDRTRDEVIRREFRQRAPGSSARVRV